MNVQSLKNCNSVKPAFSQNIGNYQMDKTENTFSTKEEKISVNESNKKYLFEYGHNDNGKLYHVKGSIAEDFTEENPKIKIEYISNDKNDYIVKYIDPRQVDFRNATVDEYYAAVYYLNNGESSISGLEKPGTTGIYYNSKDRYDFVALLERDIKIYQSNGVRHHVSHYQKILNNINTHMSTDYYKKNVVTGNHGIGVEEALTISRKKHGISDSNEKINKVMNMVDKYLESNRQKNIRERNKQMRRIQAKRKHDKEKLEKLLEKLRINRKLTQDKIFETQEERKENLARIQKENLLRKNPYDFR